MALQKSKETLEGFSYNYHRIQSINILKDETVITVKSFKDIESKDSKQPCGEIIVKIPFLKVPKADVNLANIYAELKRSKSVGEQLSGLEDAQDC